MNLPKEALEEKISATPGTLIRLMVPPRENDHTFYDETLFRHSYGSKECVQSVPKNLFSCCF